MKLKKYFFLWLLLISLGGCDKDKVKVTEQDMKKYPELRPFILSSTNFEGLHDIDLSQITFSYEVKITNPIDTIDAIALSRNWSITKKSDSERLYLKMIKDYPADDQTDSLSVVYAPAQNRLTFRWR
jgi:hypothetical protein